MNFSVEVVSPNLFPGAVADEIIVAAQEAHAAGSNGFFLALSGGRTPGAVYRALTNSSRANQVSWDKVSLFIGDERWVPLTDPASNYKMVKETLIEPLGVQGSSLFHVDTSFSTPHEGAQKYSEDILKAVPHIDGIPRLDLVLLGVGEDGHIASLFPNDPALSDKTSLAVVSVNPEDSTTRVSLAPAIILNARRVLVLVRGEGKGRILKRILTGSESSTTIPAMMLKEISDRVTWYVDSAAVSDIRELFA